MCMRDKDCRMSAKQACAPVLLELFFFFGAKIDNKAQILGKINLEWFQCSHTTCFLCILLWKNGQVVVIASLLELAGLSIPVW